MTVLIGVQSCVQYRHVIDSLVRQPGAFANYAFRDDLFPTTRFRLAYDRFGAQFDERRQAKEYLALLHYAATTAKQQSVTRCGCSWRVTPRCHRRR